LAKTCSNGYRFADSQFEHPGREACGSAVNVDLGHRARKAYYLMAIHENLTRVPKMHDDKTAAMNASLLGS
jgi:hypothetical protein